MSVCVKCVWFHVCGGSADFASSASCRRKQFSQLLKRCPKLSRHQRMFLTSASALFYRAPQGFTLSGRRYFRRGHETRLVLVPLQIGYGGRAVKSESVSLNKSVTASRLSHRLFTERTFCHLRVCGSKRSSLELSPRLTVLQALWPTHSSF